MAWIHTVSPADAGGPLEKLYDEAVARAGKVYHVVRLSSLDPELLDAWIVLYKRIMYGRSPLSRLERELVAVVVSAENGCRY